MTEATTLSVYLIVALSGEKLWKSTVESRL